MKIRRLLLALMTTLFATSISAGRIDGNQLLDWCSKEDKATQAACIFFINGVADTAASFMIREQYKYCVPDGATPRQTVDVVEKFLIDTPEKRNFTAESLVMLALMTAWGPAIEGCQNYGPE